MISKSLPFEEMLFFLLTNTMIVFGYFAFQRGLAMIDVILMQNREIIARQQYSFDFNSSVSTDFNYDDIENMRLLEQDWNAGSMSVSVRNLFFSTFVICEESLEQQILNDIHSGYVMMKKGSKSFVAALQLYPRTSQIDILCYYGFCRVTDDIADNDAIETSIRISQMSSIKKIISSIWSFSDQTSLDFPPKVKLETPEIISLHTARAEVASKFPEIELVLRNLVRSTVIKKVPKRLVDELLGGYLWDLERRVIKSDEDLVLYANHVASSVGEAMLYLMDNNQPKTKVVQAARDMGVALQIINCARDILTDAELGRIYVPESILSEIPKKFPQFVSADEVRKCLLETPSNLPHEIISFAALKLIKFAKPYNDSAWGGIKSLAPQNARPVRVALRIYNGISAEMIKIAPNYARRVFTSSKWKIFVILWDLYNVFG
ncbi:hypothetical protein HK096_011039 [Nowakowskiella sp. JEL0078]|nr:hypothetical protein HK096_011039 [Nowakowskiella sp. JEL0078]